MKNILFVVSLSEKSTKLTLMINNYDSVDTRFSSGSPTSTKQEDTSYAGKKRTWLSLVTLFVALFAFVSVQAQSTANYAFSTSTTGSLALDANGCSQ